MILGIMGGMGPAASCDLYKKIIEATHASKDQEHIHTVIDSNTQIPDRSKYICCSGEDPKIEMIRSLIRLEMMGADYIAISCNTAHYFYDDIKKYTKAKILHMVDETSRFLKNNTKKQSFLLLATEGTYISGIYKSIFNKYNLDIIEPNQTDKKIVMDWIYKVKSGDFSIELMEFEALIDKYATNKSGAVILGCTELPLLAESIGYCKEYVDPTLVLAKRCIEIAESSNKLNNI